MLYYLYNDFREDHLFDINSRIRTDAIKCEKIKLTNISLFNLNKINKDDILIITGCCIPSTINNFILSDREKYNTNDIKEYTQLLLSFNKKVILFEDIHNDTYRNFSYLFLDLKTYNIKYGISMYNCDEWDYIKQNYNWNKTFILTHHYDSTTFYNMNLEKDIDILLYGDTIECYPLRKKIKEILESMTELNVKIIPRGPYCTYDINSTIEHRKELSTLINKSHICIATCSQFNYFVCKYLEITAANSVCAGNVESIGKEIFQNNFIELNLNMSDDEIKQKLIDGLKNKSVLKQMNENVYKKTSKFSIQNNYWDNLISVIYKIHLDIPSENNNVRRHTRGLLKF